MEVAGSIPGILDEVSFFLVKIGLRGGVAGSIPDELRKKNYFGTVQPVQIGYMHLLFPTFSVQLRCLVYVHCLFNIFPLQQFFEWGHIFHLVSVPASISRRNPSVQQLLCVRIPYSPFFPLFHFFPIHFFLQFLPGGSRKI